MVPSYALTVSKNRDVSIDKFIKEDFKPDEWWECLIKTKYSLKGIASICNEEDWVLISLTLPYIQMLLRELKKLNSNLIIFSANKPFLERVGLGSYVAPYTDALDGEDSSNKGTKSDFAQRAHVDFLDRLKGKTVEEVLKSVERDMKEWRQPEKIDNPRFQDTEIIDMIKEHVWRYSSRVDLLKYFRKKLNIGCEEKRFKRLYEIAKESDQCQLNL